jgi:hypothetical protein
MKITKSMNIVIVSAFRDAVSHIDRYFSQVSALQRHAAMSDPSHTLRVVAVEGDSTDKTWDTLTSSAYTYNVRTNLVSHNHGKRKFSSTEDKDRLTALTGVMKAGMKAVDPDSDDVVLYVESDLVWTPHNVGSIIDMAYRRDGGFDVIAPMVYAGNTFYDIWGFRKNGERFGPFPPYHQGLIHSYPFQPIIEIDSAGSCLAFRSELASKVKVKGQEGLVSWCNSAREQGYKIGVATQFRVDHP